MNPPPSTPKSVLGKEVAHSAGRPTFFGVCCRAGQPRGVVSWSDGREGDASRARPTRARPVGTTPLLAGMLRTTDEPSQLRPCIFEEASKFSVLQ